MRIALITLSLISMSIGACKLSQSKASSIVAAAPTAPAPEKIFECGFKAGTYEGILPCFGNECTEFGPPLTHISLHESGKLDYTLEQEDGKRIVKSGTWRIDSDCIVEIVLEQESPKYFKYSRLEGPLVLLNAAQKQFTGLLEKHYYITKVK